MKKKNYGNSAIENTTALNAEFITADDNISARVVNRPIVNLYENQETNYNLIQTLLKTVYGNTSGIIPNIYEEFAPECFEIGSFKNNTGKYFLRIPMGLMLLKKNEAEDIVHTPFLNKGDYCYKDTQKNEQFSQDDYNSFLAENKPEINTAERQFADLIGLDLDDLTNDIKITQDLIPMTVKVAIVDENGYAKYDAAGIPMYVTDNTSNLIYLAKNGQGNLKIRYDNADAEINSSVYETIYDKIINSETQKLNNEIIRQSVVFRDNLTVVDVGEGNGEYTSDINKAIVLKDYNGNDKYKTGYYMNVVRATSGADENVYLPNIKKNSSWEIFLPALNWHASNTEITVIVNNNGKELESFSSNITGDADISSVNNVIFNLFSVNSDYFKVNKIQKDKNSSPVNGNLIEFISENPAYKNSTITIKYTSFFENGSFDTGYFQDYIAEEEIKDKPLLPAVNQKYCENIFELANNFLGYFSSSVTNSVKNIYNYLNLETIIQISNSGYYYLYYDLKNDHYNQIDTRYDKTGKFLLSDVEINDDDNLIKLFEISVEKNNILPYNLVVTKIKSFIDTLDSRLIATKKAELNSLLVSHRTEIRNHFHVKDDSNREIEMVEKADNDDDEQLRVTSPITRIVDKKDVVIDNQPVQDNWTDEGLGDTPSDFYETPYYVFDHTKAPVDPDFIKYIYNRDANNKGVIVNKNKGIRIFNNDEEELSENYSYSKFKPIEIISKQGNINLINISNRNGRINIFNLQDSANNIIDAKGKTRIRSKNNDQLVIRRIGAVNNINNIANIKFVLGNSYSKDDENSIGSNLVLGNILFNSGTTGTEASNIVENNRMFSLQLAKDSLLRNILTARNSGENALKRTISSYGNIVPAENNVMLGFPKESRSYYDSKYISESIPAIKTFTNESGTSTEFIENEDRWLASFIYKGYFGKIVLADRASDVINSDTRNGALNAGNSNLFNISSIYINRENLNNSNFGTINFDNKTTENTIFSSYSDEDTISYSGIAFVLNRKLNANPSTDTESENSQNFCGFAITPTGSEVSKNLKIRRQLFVNNHSNSSVRDNSSLVVKGQSLTNTLVVSGLNDFPFIDDSNENEITRNTSDSLKLYNEEYMLGTNKNSSRNKDDCLYNLAAFGRSYFEGDITLKEDSKFTENTTFNKKIVIKNNNYANYKFNNVNTTDCPASDPRYVTRNDIVEDTYYSSSEKLPRNNTALEILSGKVIFGSDEVLDEELTDNSDLLLYGSQWIKRRLEIGSDNELINTKMSETKTIFDTNGDNKDAIVSPTFYVKGASQFNGDVVFGASLNYDEETNTKYIANRRPEVYGSKIIFWGKNANNTDFDFHGKTWFDNEVQIGCSNANTRAEDSNGINKGCLKIFGNENDLSFSLIGKFKLDNTGTSEINGTSLTVKETNTTIQSTESIIFRTQQENNNNVSTKLELLEESKVIDIYGFNGINLSTSQGKEVNLQDQVIVKKGSTTVKNKTTFEDSVTFSGDTTTNGNQTVEGNMTVKGNLTVENGGQIIGNLAKMIFDQIYPVGSIYTTENSNFDPNDSFSGTWVRIQGKFLWSAEETEVSKTTGGRKELKLAINNIPAHVHDFTSTEASVTVSGGEHSHDVYVTNGHISGYNNNTTMRSNGNDGNQKVGYTTGGGHTHTATVKVNGSIGKTGSGKDDPDAINIMPPYYTVYAWRRTA